MARGFLWWWWAMVRSFRWLLGAAGALLPAFCDVEAGVDEADKDGVAYVEGLADRAGRDWEKTIMAQAVCLPPLRTKRAKDGAAPSPVVVSAKAKKGGEFSYGDSDIGISAFA
jgi:hypothetical protein